LKQHESELHTLLSSDLARLNALAKSLSIPDILVPTPAETSK
jgi:hypothetical protein